MTKQEYEKLYSKARDKFALISKKEITAIKKIYINAADLVSEEVGRATSLGLSEITIDSQKAIESALRNGADLVSEKVQQSLPSLVEESYSQISSIDSKYFNDVIKDINTNGLITTTGIENVTIGVNDLLIRSLVSRTYQDGFSLSERIWSLFDDNDLPIGINGDFQYRITNVIGSGFAQGRDVLKIAKDIQVYARDGKISLLNRYGTLERGTYEFAKRITGEVDWRAVRLVRSELYSSLQEAAIYQGEVNPAAFDLYNWLLTQGAMHSCICPDLASNSPYKKEDLPTYPHPNCLCTITPVLRDSREFTSDLKKWVSGEKVDYIDNWYSSVYTKFNG